MWWPTYVFVYICGAIYKICQQKKKKSEQKCKQEWGTYFMYDMVSP